MDWTFYRIDTSLSTCTYFAVVGVVVDGHAGAEFDGECTGLTVTSVRKAD